MELNGLGPRFRIGLGVALRKSQIIRLVCVVFVVATLTAASEDQPRRQEKIKGLVFTGPGAPPLKPASFHSMASLGGNFVALVPEATVYRQNLSVVYDFENQWYGEKTDATLQGIRLAREAKLKVMLKPHLTVGWDTADWSAPKLDFHDATSRKAYDDSLRFFLATQEDRTTATSHWRGDFDVRHDEDWSTFAAGYRNFILEYARLAQQHSVELYCIGTEMKKVALSRPDYWRSLIGDVREVYDGPLVYAANWDSFDEIKFWDRLDFIGVDAYFPISQAETPTVREIEAGWVEHLRRIERLHTRIKKPVIFTEWGYEDEDFAGKEPWVMGRPPGGGRSPNQDSQANAYEGTLRSVWDQPWLRGIFVWRWSPGAPGSFSPRGKRAEAVLKLWFAD